MGKNGLRVDTVDGSEIPFPSTWDGAKTRRKLKNWKKTTISTGDRRFSAIS